MLSWRDPVCIGLFSERCGVKKDGKIKAVKNYTKGPIFIKVVQIDLPTDISKKKIAARPLYFCLYKAVLERKKSDECRVSAEAHFPLKEIRLLS